MPEVSFHIRWPDGALQRCCSPSRVVETQLAPGASYPADEFLRRARAALETAGERVRERFGFACTSAAQQIDELERSALVHAFREGGDLVLVQNIEVDGVAAPPPAPERLPREVGVLVVGGGQAGLSASWHLRERGVDHLVLERNRIAHEWREHRWDSFTLVTPNWQCQLPGHPYDGDDPDGFMERDQVIDYVERFAEKVKPPLLEGVSVVRIGPGGEGGFEVETSIGDLHADQVILAVAGYHRQAIPPMGGRLPEHVAQVHSADYRCPEALPDGAVMVVGSGQSGAQIAEDLHLAERQVHLVVGPAPRIARFYRGRDVVAWMNDMGHYDLPITEHPMGLAARKEANHYVTGRDGGRDIDLRRFATEGMRLHGHLLDARGPILRFADDLAANLDNADAVADQAKDTIDEYIEQEGIEAPVEERYEAAWQPDESSAAPLDLDAAEIRSIVWATGFRSDWSFVDLPAFDGSGYPTHERGVTSVPGLYVLGLPWLHTWGSGRFAGVARDAEHVVAHAVGRAERGRLATLAA